MVGQLVIETNSAKALPAILGAASKIAVSLKFFREYAHGTATEDACATSLVLHLATSARKTGPTTVTIDFGGMHDSEVNYCEINLAS